MNKQSLFIDTDMGVDDIAAICMLITSGRFTIAGISVVNGVAVLSKGIINLNRILSFTGISCPIFEGVNQKTQASTVQFPAIDRKRANSLALLPTIRFPRKGDNPVLPLLEAEKVLCGMPDNSAIFAIGPLTNMARLTMNPFVCRQIKRWVIMGGSLKARGLVPPSYRSEYNIRLDPRAADQIFGANLSRTLIPLDATRQAPTKLVDVKGKEKQLLSRFYRQLKQSAPTSPAGKIMKSIFLNNERDFSNFYDPLAAAILIDPKIAVNTMSKPLQVSCQKQFLGEIVEGGTYKTSVVTAINQRKFYDLMIQLIKS